MTFGKARVLVIGMALSLAFSSEVFANETDTRFTNTEFVTASAIEFLAHGDPSDVKEGFLWVYRSRLGTILKQRELKPTEVAELQRLCREMRKMAQASRAGAFDSYGIEFVNGRGDVARVSPSKRTVFFFWEAGKCTTEPQRGGVS